MRYPDILTPRLRLVCLSRPLMRADLAADRPTLSRLLAADVPAAWPPEQWEPHCFEFIEQMLAQHPYTRGWNRYLVLRGEPAVLIGTIGAFPRRSGEAEVGYGLLPAWQRQGLATEAAQAMVAELFTNETVETVSAQTFPHLTASIRVMEKCGLLPVGRGDEDGTVRYQVRRQAPAKSLPRG